MNARRIGAVTAAAAIALGLAACGSSDSGSGSGSSGSASADAPTGKKIKIGTKFDQPGLGLKKGTEMSGFDVDVATYVAKELGSNAGDIEWVQAVSAQRETLLSSGQVDMIVATYSITDKRKEQVSFAGPYFIAGQDLLVRADESAIKGKADLDGKKLCSVKGSTPAQKVKDEIPGVNLQEFATYSECVAGLVSKAVDAVTTDDTILAGFAAQDQFKGKLKVVGQTFSTENYGIGLKKGDTEMCTKVTDAINKMIKDGDWEKAVQKNFGPAGYKPSDQNPPTPAACA
ncbi:MAG TPA: glutamate ABC transporter substrate-binding protein [Phycicoccus elongatus]|jgi:glutamate transport system substrate-binding protein|uniref:Putative Glutamate-binding protein (GluB) n=1 Tax=Phycicoccus elongatus Lp2 TaxID=1193181 RepID=N0E5G9_9MICO|nr:MULTISPECIES: glutamate ABC transporter substrate-binding protein [Phycicoccus]MBK8728130.1 glutamate ABC transporter substrate-binding protein [Tetrasphaera sp.]MCA0323430.1 glutamate ABC transporter substrate-binding protein [Actinomycetota bacterium]MCB1239693.1 glutamate ABC transporter substrate-binding protein [Tetrasphaera sp.]MCB9405258.1 glutamate ABC transporter substrate-binding protein [Tetrasphaera sp.]MCO5303647.1 glutamate ABC transporter substrate-binding protein [Phycicoccu